jgi:sec-independent protein translocase protein TatC
MNIPIIYIHYYSFKITGLYKYEYEIYRRKSLIYSIMLMIIILYNIIYILPNIIIFLTQFESDYLKITLKISEFVIFFINLIFITFILFIIPIIIKNNYKYIENKRRLLYMIILLLSAILTPPDVLSLILLGIPMIILIELFILMGVIENKLE